MAAPVYAFTISRAAEMPSEDEEFLWDLALNLEPEDGRLWIYGTGEQQTIAFTQHGIESLRELIADLRRDTTPLRP